MEEIKTIHDFADRIKNNISKVIIGKEKEIKLLLTALLAEGHVLIEDVPGTGKTMLAKSLSKSLAGEFRRIQFTPDLLPSDVTGINYYHQQKGEFIFRAGPVFANILLADEINRATPRTQSSLLEAMEEKQVTIDGETKLLDSFFMVIATQNPVETAGTFPLPEAQMDRFMMQISMSFPNPKEEAAIVNRFLKESPIEVLNTVCQREELKQMQKAVKEIFVHDLIKDYIVDIVQKTREKEGIMLGASPRGTLAFLRASRAYAAISGRDYVLPEDVKEVAEPVLAHRIILSNTFYKTSKSNEIIRDILAKIIVPTENFIQK